MCVIMFFCFFCVDDLQCLCAFFFFFLRVVREAVGILYETPVCTHFLLPSPLPMSTHSTYRRAVAAAAAASSGLFPVPYAIMARHVSV